LIDPLPNLPEGVTLPPMPEKIRHSGHKGRYNNNYSANSNKQYYNDSANSNSASSPSISPFQFSPLNPQPPSLIQITSFAELAAYGGFNPNKYLSPAPITMQTQIQGLNFNGQPAPQVFIPQMQYNNYQNNGNAPAAQGNQNQGQYQNNYKNKNFKQRSPKKNAQHRYEKKEGQDGKKQKGEKN
jgi:hypothetical protein